MSGILLLGVYGAVIYVVLAIGLGAFTWAIVAGFAFVGLYLAYLYVSARELQREIASLAPIIRPLPKVKDRVRLLVAIPELGLEIGRTGRIKLVYMTDDIEYWIRIDGREQMASVCFTENEAWMFEVIPEQARRRRRPRRWFV